MDILDYILLLDRKMGSYSMENMEYLESTMETLICDIVVSDIIVSLMQLSHIVLWTKM